MLPCANPAVPKRRKKNYSVLSTILAAGSPMAAKSAPSMRAKLHKKTTCLSCSDRYDASRAALRDANLTPADVDYINAHGTSTGLGDMGELAAVQELFGDAPVSMSSTKSMTGHLLGAAGAVEAIFCALAIRDGVVPPTINLNDPEDAVGNFDLVPNVAKKRKVDVAISNSFGFGGTNASLVLKKVAQ